MPFRVGLKEQTPTRIVQRRPLADAGQYILQRLIVFAGHEHTICGDYCQIEALREVDGYNVEAKLFKTSV